MDIEHWIDVTEITPFFAISNVSASVVKNLRVAAIIEASQGVVHRRLSYQHVAAIEHPRGKTLQNLFDSLPTTVRDEVMEVLASCDHARIQRIVSQGHASPTRFWYDQDEHEWVAVFYR